MKYPLLIKLYIVILKIIHTWRWLRKPDTALTADRWLVELDELPTRLPIPHTQYEKRLMNHIYTWMDDERWRVSPASSYEEYQLYTR